MTALQVSALTDFLLACLAFFCAGALAGRHAQPRSAAWYWRGAMFFLALAALLGGTDHGFVEPAGLARAPIQRTTWVVLGLMTASVLLTLGAQFLGPTRQRLLGGLAAAQLLAYLVAVVVVDSFLVVVVNYLPVILAMLAFNVHGLWRGRGEGPGHWTIVFGLLVLLLASTVQALRIDTFSPLDHDALYHLISMPGVVLLYFGGRRLKTQA
jgi:hypothetical protein